MEINAKMLEEIKSMEEIIKMLPDEEERIQAGSLLFELRYMKSELIDIILGNCEGDPEETYDVFMQKLESLL